MLDDLKAMESADAVLSLRDATIAAFSRHGIERVFFLAPVSNDRSHGRYMSNIGFPEEWETAWRAGGREHDPLADYGLRQRAAFRLADGISGMPLTAAEKAYIASLSKWGMADGIGIITYGPGTRCGFVYAAAAADSKAEPDVTPLRTIAQMSYLRYCDLIDQETEQSSTLSYREMQVLYWIAMGKSNSVTADILGISSSTVDTHVRRIYAKLDSHDRTSAALTAVEKGFISLPSDVPPSILKRQG